MKLGLYSYCVIDGTYFGIATAAKLLFERVMHGIDYYSARTAVRYGMSS